MRNATVFWIWLSLLAIVAIIVGILKYMEVI